MSLFDGLLKALSVAADDLIGANAKKTLCCGVRMHDVWMHAETCPQSIKAREQYRAWREAHPKTPVTDAPNFVAARGENDSLCPECGYPIGHFGIYTVGEPCSYCGYVERRTPKR